MTTVISDVPRASPVSAVTVARPRATAVTSPDASTRATEASLDDHPNVASLTANPFPSNASAASRTVSPGVTVSAAGDTTTATGAPRAKTVSCARAIAPAEATVISVSPTETPVTRPPPSTTATSVSPDAHANSGSMIACPFASIASAASRTVSATKTVSPVGDTVTALASWATVTVAVPDTEPAVAVTVAVPLPVAVTRPEALFTPATKTSLLDHETAAPAIACPFWSRTCAASCVVAPKAVSAAVAGVTVTVVGVAGVVGSDGPVGGSTAPSPQA